MKAKLLLPIVLLLVLAVSSYAQTDPGTGNITHEWTFDDVNDPYGDASGSLFGTTTLDQGDLLIDAADEYMVLPAILISISDYTELSVSTWFSTLDTAGIGPINTGFHMIWYFGGSEVDGVGGTINLGSNGIFLSPARGDDVCRTAISCGNVATPWTTENGVNYTPEIAFGGDLWHIVTTINDSYISLYINGDLIDTANLSIADNRLANLSDDNAWIGRGGYAGDPNYWCRVHKLTMYDKMLSADEVLYLYQNPSAVNDITTESGFKVWAANGNIYIENDRNAKIESVKVYDVTGSLVYQTKEINRYIRHNLPPSIYIVKLQSNLGDYVSKILVK